MEEEEVGLERDGDLRVVIVEGEITDFILLPIIMNELQREGEREKWLISKGFKGLMESWRERKRQRERERD